MALPPDARRARWIGLLPVIAIAAIVFWLTAYPTITWWDSSQYSLAAATLGVTGPPGSLLLTLLGWPVTRLPFDSPAHALNLFAGLLAAVTAGLVYLVALRLARSADGTATFRGGNAAAVAGAALGALAFAFGETAWEHAVKFTPYILTAAFTAIILWTMLRWWDDADQPRAWRRLALLGLLFGLDFSVHRTNALLLPALLAWILVRHPRTLASPRAWLGGAGGLAAGLAVHLLIIPIAASTDSILNMGDASTWTRFWDYVSLQQMGGGFLVDLFPRKSAFWAEQTADLVRVVGANFFRWDGPLGPIGALPALVGIVGLAHLWRGNRRLATAFTLVLVLQAAATVLYFNIPADFFRPLDRHYLPVCVTCAIAVAYGCGVLLQEGARLVSLGRRAVALAGAVLLLLVPVAQLVANWTARDASHRYFASDFARNLLAGLPRDAILFTAGDNDTFPLLYVHAVEGVRLDVRIVNRPLTNTFWYVDQMVRRDSTFPVSLTREARLALGAREWPDTTLVIPVEGTAQDLGLPADTPMPDSITLDAKPTAGSLVLPADLVMLDMLRANRWRRPLCFSVTVGQQGMGWLQPYGRLDGLFWRVVPVANAPVDLATLRTNLLETYVYRGYADPGVVLDDVTRQIGTLYTMPFMTLLNEERERGGIDRCRAAAARLEAAIPRARLGGGAPTKAAAQAICEAG
jgi:hypothetical protein